MTDAGIVLLDKPAGLSSAQALSRLKKKLSLDRLGHAGTLDPMATGLLVCMVGSATRLADYAQAGAKCYSGLIQLGLVTDSDDVTGECLQRCAEIPGFEAVRNSVSKFVGKIVQVPPRVSAVKIDGERAYRRARNNEVFEIKAREVTVDSFEVWPSEDPALIGFRVRCSKGTYIRSLARDIGEGLACGGCLAQLRREESGVFSVSHAKTLEDVTAEDIQPWECLFPDMPRLILDAVSARRILNGDQKTLAGIASEAKKQVGNCDNVIYCVQGESRPWGLLKSESGGWCVVANFVPAFA